MFKKIVFSIFFISCFYFLIYLFLPSFRSIVAAGGILAYLHVIMSILLFIGLFLFVVSVLHYLFVE